MNKSFVSESVEHYREIIDDYNKTIAEDKKLMLNPNTSKKKRHAYRMLIEVMEKEKRECQGAIKRLLNE